MELTRSPDGRWTCRAEAAGEVDLPMPGGDPGGLGDALDCDLGFSPLTNTMPVLRHQLHRRAGAAELTMAWVSVPDLSLHVSEQRYQHLRTTPTGAVVRFASAGFTADLVVDGEGLLVDYPQLARRITGR